MGKTAKGAVWLDPVLFSPYDFYQYWVNCDDRDVGRFLRLYTLLPLDEIRRLETLKDHEINEAKRLLAYEATKLTHGEAAANESRAAALALFGKRQDVPGRRLKVQSSDHIVISDHVTLIPGIPTTAVPRARLEAGISPAELFTDVGLTPSRAEAKRLIKQGGLTVNDERIDSLERMLTTKDLGPEGLVLKAGKKKFHRVVPG
jgi:tyrosyl-tRNA synthetase